jgi:hypothetical protein
MLILNPRLVAFGSQSWPDIAAIAIDRAAHRTVEDWSDLGPYAVLADVPEQKVRISITQEVARDDVHVPRPGESGTLSFCTSPTASDAGRRRFTCTAVILDVRHDLSLRKGALRTITLGAISPDGSTDPITATDATDGTL